MISRKRIKELMEITIAISNNCISENGKISPKVGAVLADANGNILEQCYRGETGIGHHCEYGLIEKSKTKGIDFSNTVLFVTLEPCVSRGKGKIPCAQRIVESGIKAIYIGMLDPNPIITGKGELYLRSKGIKVNRYPHELICKLDNINVEFIRQFKDSFLPNDSLFMSKSIPQIMREFLNNNGYQFNVDLPNDWNLTLDYVIAYCKSISEKELNELKIKLNFALGYAYDKKYLDQTYKDDVRGNYNQWITIFNNILNELHIGSLNYLSTLVVGIGNGHEGEYLYSDIVDLTIVDIAPKSLDKAKALLPSATSFILNAQDLYLIDSYSKDAYISLMTYQSSYFDIDKALVEAYRVLKKEGIIIISIACGYMKNRDVYIDGLIDPKTDLVDRNRPYDLISKIRIKLIDFKFVSLGIRTSPSEIFIFARKNCT